MNDLDSMPPKCHDCSYWEMCEYPYACPTHDEKEGFEVKHEGFEVKHECFMHEAPAPEEPEVTEEPTE